MAAKTLAFISANPPSVDGPAVEEGGRRHDPVPLEDLPVLHHEPGGCCAPATAPSAAHTITENAARRMFGSFGLLARRRDAPAGLPGVLVEPAHHVELRPDVIRRLRSGAVILL